MAIKSKKVRRTGRDRRRTRIRKSIVGHTDRVRLSVYKSSKYTYAQLIMDANGQTLASASTHDKDVAEEVRALGSAEKEANRAKSSKGVLSAYALGRVLGKKASEKQIKDVVFDRNGFLYHGRIEAVARGAREQGLNF